MTHDERLQKAAEEIMGLPVMVEATPALAFDLVEDQIRSIIARHFPDEGRVREAANRLVEFLEQREGKTRKEIDWHCPHMKRLVDSLEPEATP